MGPGGYELLGRKDPRRHPNRHYTCFPAGLHILRGITKMEYPPHIATMKSIRGSLDGDLHQVAPIDVVGSESANFKTMVDADFFHFIMGDLFQIAGNQS